MFASMILNGEMGRSSGQVSLNSSESNGGASILPSAVALICGGFEQPSAVYSACKPWRKFCENE